MQNVIGSQWNLSLEQVSPSFTVGVLESTGSTLFPGSFHYSLRNLAMEDNHNYKA